MFTAYMQNILLMFTLQLINSLCSYYKLVSEELYYSIFAIVMIAILYTLFLMVLDAYHDIKNN